VSRDWSVACLDCDDDVGIRDANHAEEGCRKLASDAPKLALMPGLIIDYRATYGIGGYGTVSTDWFVRHAGHRIRARDEYGEADGTCGKDAKCNCCERRFACGRDAEHGGECAPR